MIRRKFPPGYNSRQLAFRCLCVFIAAASAFLLLDARLRPAIYSLAENGARQMAVAAINGAVESVLTQQQMDYDDIARISVSSDGMITGISTDIIKMNLLKAKVTKEIDKRICAMKNIVIDVPFGSATGVSIFYGSGPIVKVKLAMASSTTSDFKNEFTEAGLNQTQHSIMLTVTSQVTMLMPDNHINSVIETDFCVAQTVIVGVVPEVMAELS